MASPAKARLFDLYPQDAEALKRIRERLQLGSDALAIRVALRSLSRRLIEPEAHAEPAQKGEPNA
jgi:hypothetical protein